MATVGNTQRSLVVVLVVASAVVGFLFGKQSQTPGSLTQNSQKESVANSLFQSQSATALGIITKVDGNHITFVTDKNQTGTFPTASKVTIYKFAKSSQAKAFSDIKDIELNKKVVIGLQLINNAYQITTITYPFSPTPSPSRSPTPTKKR